MARPEREYRRLPGRGRRRGSFFAFTATRAGLWAGKDHLICVFSTNYTEEYKRFYYRDIQAFVTRKTGRGAAWNAVSSLFLFLFSLLALTRASATAAAVFWILAGIFLLALAGNLLLGPTCVCHVQTAVSREELPSLGRERNARKAIDLLKPLIEAGHVYLAQPPLFKLKWSRPNPVEYAYTDRERDGLRSPARIELRDHVVQHVLHGAFRI